jgi:hypothetical protein
MAINIARRQFICRARGHGVCAPARRPPWVMNGKAQNEHITSGLPATADIARTSGNGREVPEGDIRPLSTWRGFEAKDVARMVSSLVLSAAEIGENRRGAYAKRIAREL